MMPVVHREGGGAGSASVAAVMARFLSTLLKLAGRDFGEAILEELAGLTSRGSDFHRDP